ncbi:hypothetical protein EVAR_30020_1 [Eumeta japonica]|uniref:Uncharacterized protein n=1 Tax=Eumeta variegata TaxID=151549 RepID=A0A4C1VX18_EUMVA|nr:hypothetical protein EVAR_30020_1 [Eumeta japonica]
MNLSVGLVRYGNAEARVRAGPAFAGSNPEREHSITSNNARAPAGPSRPINLSFNAQNCCTELPANDAMRRFSTPPDPSLFSPAFLLYTLAMHDNFTAAKFRALYCG